MGNRFKRTVIFIYLAIFASLNFAGCSENGSEENVVERFTIQNAIITEGSANQSIELTVSVKGSLISDISVSFDFLEGSARFDEDFLPSEGDIFFQPGKSEANIPIQIIGDNHFELSETFALQLNYEGLITTFNLSINDDDEMGEVQIGEDGFYTPDTYPSMHLKWSDEFNGSELNISNWSYEIGNGCNEGICGWGNEEQEDYTDDESNSRLEDGKLIITARDEEGGYSSARIKTEDKVELKYGRIDIRAKLPKGQGIWPAIWMLGANIDDVGWPACGEIDIMELVGHEPGIIYGTVHYDNGGYESSSSMKGLSDGTYSDQFHVFTIMWERDVISWYVDNQKFKTFTNSGINNYPFNAPFFFIMNVAVGGRWPGNPDQTTVFPQEMIVDYIRVFQ